MTNNLNENEKIVYSKINGQRRPPCNRTRLNEPNLELMAKAFLNLYYATKGDKKDNNPNIEYEDKVVLGIPDVMKLMGIGRVYAEKLMWGDYFPTVQIGNRKLVHKEILEQWIKKGESIIKIDS